jgi:hypothetical protein
VKSFLTRSRCAAPVSPGSARATISRDLRDGGGACPADNGTAGLEAPIGLRAQPGAAIAPGPPGKDLIMSNKTVVLAIFKDEVSADAAAASLKDSGVTHGDAIGVLVLNEKGELKADKVGKRSWGKGTGIGAVVALVTPVGLAAGLIGGGLLGALHHKNLGLDEADRDRIGSELQGGKAAVGVLAPVSEATFLAGKLTDLGGTAETHPVSDEAVEEAQTAATTDES